MHHHPQNQERALNLSILIVSGQDLSFSNVLLHLPLFNKANSEHYEDFKNHLPEADPLGFGFRA